MSPESARPFLTGTSMPGCQRSLIFASDGVALSANALSTPRASSTRSGARWCTARSRTARCSAADSGRRRSASGRASILPAPHPARTAIERSSPSSTVLPTPRRPVSTRLRSGRPRATRSRTTSNAPSSRSRPASSGGRWPAPGAYGFRTGSMRHLRVGPGRYERMDLSSARPIPREKSRSACRGSGRLGLSTPCPRQGERTRSRSLRHRLALGRDGRRRPDAALGPIRFLPVLRRAPDPSGAQRVQPRPGRGHEHAGEDVGGRSSRRRSPARARSATSPRAPRPPRPGCGRTGARPPAACRARRP